MDYEKKYQALLKENKQLKLQLEQYRQILQQNNLLSIDTVTKINSHESTTTLSKHEVITQRLAIYQKLFRGRQDVFALRWIGAEKAGYSPAKSSKGQLLPLTKDVLYDHLSGKLTVGIYPMLPDNSCFFLAFDFDKKDWKEDVISFIQVTRNYQLHTLVEISQSGQGCHIWLFFSERVPATLARKLGGKLLKEAAFLRQQTSLSSFDRMFPTQDVLTENGLGNLIALPLQGEKRKTGKTVFVEHLHILKENLKSFTKNVIILTGALSKKELKQQFEKLDQLPDHEERIILATGKYAGEGFDHPRLDTIFLTMPVSWKGTLAQYVGRLHRAYEGKESVEVYDYVDHKDEAFLKMYEKRLKGYKSLGYSTVEEAKKEKRQLRLF